MPIVGAPNSRSEAADRQQNHVRRTPQQLLQFRPRLRIHHIFGCRAAASLAEANVASTGRITRARFFHRRCDRKTIRDGFSVTRELAKADGDRASSDEGVTTSLSTLCRWGAWELDDGK
jgi:hypothetical protein